jgi:hypothetical protein
MLNYAMQYAHIKYPLSLAVLRRTDNALVLQFIAGIKGET